MDGPVFGRTLVIEGVVSAVVTGWILVSLGFA
jgi:hypothetical protein